MYTQINKKLSMICQVLGKKENMFDRDIKISSGLLNLISGKKSADHFRNINYSDIFIDNPQYRSDYFDMFSKAQVVEIANSRNLG